MINDFSPLWISLKIAFFASFITLVLGVAAARLVCKTEKAKHFLDGLFTLPMVLPPTVTGFFLLILFGKNSPLGRALGKAGINVVFSAAGAVIAAAVVAFPLMYRSARGAFEQLDPDYIACARTLGMKESKIFFRVILPNTRPGLLSGVVLSFARSMGEFGATTLLAGNIPGRTQTMALAVYSAVQNNHKEAAMRWSLIIVVISFLAIFLMNRTMKRYQGTEVFSGALFRADKSKRSKAEEEP